MDSLALLFCFVLSLLEGVVTGELASIPACCGNNTLGYPQCNDSFPGPSFSFWPNRSINYGAPMLCTEHSQLGPENFTIQADGTLVKPRLNQDSCLIRSDVPYDRNSYCLDYDVVTNKSIAYVCVISAEAHVALKICSVASAVHLAITISIYSTNKSLTKWSSVAYLVSQSIALECAFVVHSARLFSPKPPGCTLCLLSGYCLQYFFLAAFFWMNANCGNIYLITSQLQLQSGNLAHDEMRKKRFVRASIYAWGAPFVICLLTFILHMYGLVPDRSYRPEIGFTTCFLGGWKAKSIYFYAPMAVILVVNMVLFGLTFTNLIKHKLGIRNVKTSQTRLQRELWYYKQYLKLFIVTGLSWAGEVIGYTFNEPGDSDGWKDYLWLGLDVFNCLQGVFIFNIFICPTKIRSSIKWLPDWLRGCSCQPCAKKRKYSIRSSSTHNTQGGFETVKLNGSQRTHVDVMFDKTREKVTVTVPTQESDYAYTGVKTCVH